MSYAKPCHMAGLRMISKALNHDFVRGAVSSLTLHQSTNTFGLWRSNDEGWGCLQ